MSKQKKNYVYMSSDFKHFTKYRIFYIADNIVYTSTLLYIWIVYLIDLCTILILLLIDILFSMFDYGLKIEVSYIFPACCVMFEIYWIVQLEIFIIAKYYGNNCKL